MSQLQSSGTHPEFDLHEDLALYFVIKVRAEPENARKVIYEAGQADTKVRFTVGLDHNSNLRVWIIDASGTTMVTDGVGFAAYLDRAVVLEVVSQLVSPKKLEVAVGVNDQVRVVSYLTDVASDRRPGTYSIGTTIEGTQPASFGLGELLSFSKALSRQDRQRLMEYFRHKWDVGGNGG